MNREEALELAREVDSGKARSYVSAAIALSKWLIAEEARRPAPTQAQREGEWCRVALLPRIVNAPAPGEVLLGKRLELQEVVRDGQRIPFVPRRPAFSDADARPVGPSRPAWERG